MNVESIKYACRTSLTLGLSILFVSVQAQYISSVTTPDKSKPKIEDITVPAVLFASDITTDDLYDHLSVLASDEFEGRETGYPGNEKAANYIARHFKGLGLQTTFADSYFQPIAFTKSLWDENEMTINGERFKHLWDYLAFPSGNENIGEINADEVVFLGYGIDDPKYSDYRGVNVRDKVIMIYKGEPMRDDSIFQISGTNQLSDWGGNINRKLSLAKEKGAKMVLIIEDELKDFLFKNRKYFLNPRLELGDLTNVEIATANHMYISSGMAKAIIGSNTKKFSKVRKKINKKGKAKALPFAAPVNIKMTKSSTVIAGNNVIAWIPGTDLKEEYIVVSAHYDHIGKKGDDIFNGADDNGSGTSTVLELAESFAKAADAGFSPRRSIIFMLVTGEEKGLLGSEYYAENPIFPLENTIADVNVDMVGRVDDAHKDDPYYIYVIGSDRLSKDLHDVNEQVNQDYTQLILDYKYNDEKDPNRYYYRSDHYNFASRGIPAIFFFNGTHEDYHQPGDTIDKIHFEKMAAVGKHIFHLTWELANRDQRIRLIEQP